MSATQNYLAVCRCGAEGVVVLYYEPTEHSEDDDIAVSIWREWQPNSLRWRIRQAWAVLREQEKIAEWGVLLSMAEADGLSKALSRFAALAAGESAHDAT